MKPGELHVIWKGGESEAKGSRRTVSVTAIHTPTGIEITHTREKPEGHTRREARIARDTLLTRCLDELEVAVGDWVRLERASRSTRRHGERTVRPRRSCLRRILTARYAVAIDPSRLDRQTPR